MTVLAAIEYIWQQANVLDGRQEIVLSTDQCRILTNTIHCRKTYYTGDRWKGLVAKEDCVGRQGITSSCGRASYCRRCFASQTTEADRIQ